MSTFKWLVICLLLTLQLIVLLSIAGSVQVVAIELYNAINKTYHIKQIPQDQLPKEAEIEI